MSSSSSSTSSSSTSIVSPWCSFSSVIRPSVLEQWTSFVWRASSRDAQKLEQQVFFNVLSMVIVDRQSLGPYSEITISSLKHRIVFFNSANSAVVFSQPVQFPIPSLALPFYIALQEWGRKLQLKHLIVIGGGMTPQCSQAHRIACLAKQIPRIEPWFFGDFFERVTEHEYWKCYRPLHMYRYQQTEWKQCLERLRLYNRTTQTYLVDDLPCMEVTDRMARQYDAAIGDIMEIQHESAIAGPTRYWCAIVPKTNTKI
jgi:DNA-directed RNA polymerase subunit H (RpoH/RPB5)